LLHGVDVDSVGAHHSLGAAFDAAFMARFWQGPARHASVIRKRRDFGMAVGRRIANQANRSRSILSAPLTVQAAIPKAIWRH
jgi:hypothetical protein